MVERRRSMAPVLLAPAAMLLLAGCAATHVGDDWQCPIAQGAVCASVAAADPAVAEAGEAERLAVPRPLYGSDVEGPGPEAAPEPRSGCGQGCNPFAWLGRLFAGDADAGTTDAAHAGSAGEVVDGSRDAGRVATAEPHDGEDGTPETPDPAAAPGLAGRAVPLSAAALSGGPVRTDENRTPALLPDRAAGDALRTPETVGRVWIGPFVDGDGIYREASWVQVVIAPAAWRLP